MIRGERRCSGDDADADDVQNVARKRKKFLGVTAASGRRGDTRRGAKRVKSLHMTK